MWREADWWAIGGWELIVVWQDSHLDGGSRVAGRGEGGRWQRKDCIFLLGRANALADPRHRLRGTCFGLQSGWQEQHVTPGHVNEPFDFVSFGRFCEATDVSRYRFHRSIIIVYLFWNQHRHRRWWAVVPHHPISIVIQLELFFQVLVEFVFLFSVSVLWTLLIITFFNDF